jgi:predicted RNase H-like nuclease (RuvC/YqgF family)
MKRHNTIQQNQQTTIINQLIHENHILRTQHNEILQNLIDSQKQIENMKSKYIESQENTDVLRILQNKNTELNRELVKKNKQISMLLNNTTDGGSIISELLIDDLEL